MRFVSSGFGLYKRLRIAPHSALCLPPLTIFLLTPQRHSQPPPSLNDLVLMSLANSRSRRVVRRSVKAGGSSTTEHIPGASQPGECTCMAHALYSPRCLLTSSTPCVQVPHHATLPVLKTPRQPQLAGVLPASPPHLPGARLPALPLAGRKSKRNAPGT